MPVGTGTVEMNGKGFSAMVSEGRSVEKGEPEFSQEEIRAARPVQDLNGFRRFYRGAFTGKRAFQNVELPL